MTDRLTILDEVETTMTTARQMVSAGTLTTGHAVLARHQTAGRGRSEREWLSTPGGSLLLTIYRQEVIDPLHVGLIAIATGVAIAETVEALGIQPRLKWPNDILVNDRKLAGVLITTRIGRHAIDVFAGIGMNVSDVPAGLSNPATSLANHAGQVPPLERLAADVVSRWNAAMAQLETGANDDLVARWTERAAWIGQQVNLVAGQVISGTLVGIDSIGRLVLDSGNGHRAFTSGEVVHGPRRIG